MASMTLKDKENMVKVIRGFYGDAFTVTPEQISEEVVAILDKMVKDIASCTRKVKFIVDLYEFFYTNLPVVIIANKIVANKVIKATLDNTISNWTKDARKQFATRACVNSILLQGRTRLQNALLNI